MNSFPEPMLRPVFEIPAAAIFITAAAVFILAPDRMNLSLEVSLAVAAPLVLVACIRLRQALRVCRYQRRLTRRRPFMLRSTPTDPARLYIGRGFKWSQPHVQRLKEARQPAALKYINTETELGGDPILHGVGMLEGDREVWTNLAERFGHMLVLGTTRVGKTRLAELLISQDIARGDTVIVLDPKGDTDLLRRIHHEAKKAGRLKSMRITHLRYPNESQAYNPIAAYSSPTEIATRIADQLPSKGDSAAFAAFGWRFCNAIAQALDALGRTPNYRSMYEYLQNIDPLLTAYYAHLFNANQLNDWKREVDAIQVAGMGSGNSKNERRSKPSGPAAITEAAAMIEFYRQTGIDDDIATELAAVHAYDRLYYEKIIASLMPLLSKLKSGRTATLLTPQESDPRVLDWSQVIRDRNIVYVGLDALANPAVARAVGNAMFADLASAAGSIYANIESGTERATQRIAIHADEFNDIVGPHIHAMLSKSGGAGVQITAYTQTLADIEASLEGGRAEAARIIGNFNSLVMLRVRTLDTAKTLVEQVPAFDVIELAESASVADSSQAQSDVAFTSSSSERMSARSVAGLNASDLMRLPKGEAFALLDGGTIWKLRIPLLEDPGDDMSVLDIMSEVR